ncbi:MAG: ABC transporter ATP-binding protein [Alphaproteobacteria bacterium]|nr:ABC transporter ATP-binding protein [Alphaproteobacteria bacterium]
MTPALAIERLSVGYRVRGGTLQALRDVSLTIAPGEVVGLVGESGSGKSTLAYAAVRYLAANAAIGAGRVLLAGEDLLEATPQALRQIRGRRIGMVYQDPGTALNPSLRLGEQVAELLRTHLGLDARAAEARTAELLRMVALPDPQFIMRRYPHEVSGGEKQRVLIAMAFACDPDLLVLDEPTTALDATTAAGILDLIRALQQRTGVAVLYITHDLGIVAEIAQRLAVIYAGTIVEEGPTEAVLRRPRHFYTRMLLASLPNPARIAERRRLVSFPGLPPDLRAPPAGCVFADRCPAVEAACRTAPPVLAGDAQKSACRRADIVAASDLGVRPVAAANGGGGEALLRAEGITVEYRRIGILDRLRGRPGDRVSAVSDVDLVLARGETVGLVGESGCGKSTLARALSGLVAWQGRLVFDGRPIAAAAAMDRAYRRRVQLVFQNPDQSLNPRMRIGTILSRPLRLYHALSGKALAREIAAWLDRVRLPESYARRHPHELSGGEKQRVAIARAFAADPAVVLCDEITSGLDVSIQAAILNLLMDLQAARGTTLLLISHDLNMVQHFADRIAVMYLGKLVELRPAYGMARPPFHPYSEALLAAVPVAEPGLHARAVRLHGPLPSPKNPPAGCRFHSRCPRKLGAVCEAAPPPVRTAEDDHWIRCQIPLGELAAVPPIWQREPA